MAWVTPLGKTCINIYSGVRQSFIMTRDNDTGDIMVMVVSKDITVQVQKQREQTQALQEALIQRVGDDVLVVHIEGINKQIQLFGLHLGLNNVDQVVGQLGDIAWR